MQDSLRQRRTQARDARTWNSRRVLGEKGAGMKWDIEAAIRAIAQDVYGAGIFLGKPEQKADP